MDHDTNDDKLKAKIHVYQKTGGSPGQGNAKLLGCQRIDGWIWLLLGNHITRKDSDVGSRMWQDENLHDFAHSAFVGCAAHGNVQACRHSLTCIFVAKVGPEADPALPERRWAPASCT